MPSSNGFSPRLERYLTWIEAETGRELLIEPVADLGMPGMRFAFRDHPSRLHVLYVHPPPESSAEFEQSVAHEATHGLLLYGLGYVTMKPVGKLSREVRQSVGIVGTMIDDVVVNRILDEHGFGPWADIYPAMLARETRAAREGRPELYAEISDHPEVRRRFRVYRCVAALAYLALYGLSTDMRRELGAFTDAFEAAYPEDGAEAAWIAGLLEELDVFTASGHRRILRQVLERWGLKRSVRLEPARDLGESIEY